jgi:hypothetical protein
MEKYWNQMLGIKTKANKTKANKTYFYRIYEDDGEVYVPMFPPDRLKMVIEGIVEYRLEDGREVELPSYEEKDQWSAKLILTGKV